MFILQGFKLWEHMDSNQGPSACKADALNQLSYAPLFDLKSKIWSVNIKLLFEFCNNFLIFLMSERRDSNPRLSAWEANTLPTELRSLFLIQN